MNTKLFYTLFFVYFVILVFNICEDLAYCQVINKAVIKQTTTDHCRVRYSGLFLLLSPYPCISCSMQQQK